MNNSLRLLSALLILLVSFSLQLFLRESIGNTPDFLLGALLTLSFFMGVGEFFFLLGSTVAMIFWQPNLTLEISMWVIVALLIFYLRRFFPWHPILGSALVPLGGVFLFYAGIGSTLFVGHIMAIVQDATLTAVYGIIVFQVFHFVYKPFAH